MDLTINGGYGAYADVALLQISILYLQRHDFNRRTSGNAGVPLSQSIDDYLLTTRFVAAGLNWASWLLAVYIWQEYGLASAALFFLLALGSSVWPPYLFLHYPASTSSPTSLASQQQSIYSLRLYGRSASGHQCNDDIPNRRF